MTVGGTAVGVGEGVTGGGVAVGVCGTGVAVGVFWTAGVVGVGVATVGTGVGVRRCTTRPTRLTRSILDANRFAHRSVSTKDPPKATYVLRRARTLSIRKTVLYASSSR